MRGWSPRITSIGSARAGANTSSVCQCDVGTRSPTTSSSARVVFSMGRRTWGSRKGGGGGERGGRYVACHNPHEENRQRTHRRPLLRALEAELASLKEVRGESHS